MTLLAADISMRTAPKIVVTAILGCMARELDSDTCSRRLAVVLVGEEAR
jgi:hypothetical protein